MARCMNCGENVRKGAMCKCYGKAERTTLRKVASDVGAKEPKIKSMEVGSYKSNSKAGNPPTMDGSGRPATRMVTPKQTETYDNVPDKGFKSVSVGNLEVGSYKSNRNAGDAPSK